MMELEELKIATNWQGIIKGTDCYVIAFDEAEAGLIQGLAQNDQTFYLRFPEYQQHLISFLVRRGPEETYQYWTLGERLHRINAPAKVAIRPHEAMLEYHHNGLLHRTDGPAQIKIVNPKTTDVHPRTQEEINTDYWIEEWDRLEGYWYESGVAPRGKPFSVLCENGHRIYRVTGPTPLLENFKQEPAFSCAKLTQRWSPPVEGFGANFLVATDYSRSYRSGSPERQTCSELSESHWIVNGNIVEADETVCQRLRQHLFSGWNIWEGPLFSDEQDEFFALTEVTA